MSLRSTRRAEIGVEKEVRYVGARADVIDRQHDQANKPRKRDYPEKATDDERTHASVFCRQKAGYEKP